MLVAGALTLALGGLGLAQAYAGDSEAVERARDSADGILRAGLVHVPGTGEDLAPQILDAVANPPLRFALAPVGLLLVALALRPSGGGGGGGKSKGKAQAETADAEMGRAAVGGKLARKAKKDAAALARKGEQSEAAELCFSAGLLDEAADYFIEAGEPSRAAEIRHDQNRFLESAELYAKAGNHSSAAVIFAQQNEFGRAAEANLAAGNLSQAAEMFEKSGDFRRAAECYEKTDFPRDAARCWGKCQQWLRAAKCLDQELVEAAGAANRDDRAREDYGKLVRMAAQLYQRGGELEKAENVLVKGSLWEQAAELADKRGDAARAVELFQKARQAPRAAKALEKTGNATGAARILAEYHRDRGEHADAATQFEKAGELLEAADLYRLLERYAEAAGCYDRAGSPAQAAEMFSAASDRPNAARCFERAGKFAEAAECWALEGDDVREAEMLEKAGANLRAGQVHREKGRADAAIAALQSVAPGHADFAGASALLGEIFRERQMYPVAIAKLRDALGENELDRTNHRVFYCLATVHEASGDFASAVALYEKLLAFDVRYEDVHARLQHCRDEVAKAAPAGAAGGGAPQARSGRYAIRGTLGRGGMGVVYKADDTVLDRTVAFKVLPDALRENPQALKNFLREAKSAAQLNHPNIVMVYDAGEQDGVFYIAMEYVDGHTLKEIIKRRGRIAPKGVAHVVSQMSEALAYAHDKKIVHRDIKTANAMWTVDRKAKIMDFGLAKVIEEVRNHTTVVSGTPYYMSPEQTLGKNVDQRTDIYSLGVSVFEMATGGLPFTEGNLPYHHVHTPPPDPLEVVPDLPPVLAQIIDRCMRKDPDERYQNAREILAELRAAPIG
ncbi:MAG TPA: protein kinase [Myxococcota bacterium]|nr:protein kinase [Myxococcota bacterium]